MATSQTSGLDPDRGTASRDATVEKALDDAPRKPTELTKRSWLDVVKRTAKVSRNGKAHALKEWRDTVLVPPRESVEIAFVADNPGDWMFHCHVADHQETGMMATLRIS